jgi:hypothetical protein
MSSVIIAGNVSGTITLDAPAVAGTTTLTLPATTGTVVTKDTNGILSVNGVQFPATAVPSADANTLDDYEEGTFTPIDASGAGLTFTFPSGGYTKIGDMVFSQARFIYPSTASGATVEIGGFPFAAATSGVYYGAYIVYQTYGTPLQGRTVSATTIFLSVAGGTSVTNANLSGAQIQLVYIYRVA